MMTVFLVVGAVALFLIWLGGRRHVESFSPRAERLDAFDFDHARRASLDQVEREKQWADAKRRLEEFERDRTEPKVFRSTNRTKKRAATKTKKKGAR
jgi:hypothetical protein